MRIRWATPPLLATALAGWFLHGASIAAPQSLVLAEEGTTACVLTGAPDEPDIRLALAELADHLRTATGADFRTVTLAVAEGLPQRIVVGNNALSRAILGEAVASSLRPAESLVAKQGRDVVLVGGSHRASLYAAYSFLENEIGCRWYAVVLDPVIPRNARLAVSEGSRRERPAFGHRNGGFNGLSDRQRNEQFCLRNRYPDIEPRGKIDPGCHTLFYYVPPHAHEECYALWGHPPRSHLFETHPEFFSLSAAGQRVDNLQVCFSNPGLRALLTSQIDAVIRKSAYRDHGYIALDANDVPGKFCHCPGCLNLEARYEAVGGPLYDYLIELCAFLRREHPGVWVKTLAYRRDQTERPPKLERLPDNLIVHFAPIDNNFAVRLDHPTNRETLDRLRRWCEIARTVWVWYYTNPFLTAGPPFANLQCIADDLRTLHGLGVSGVTFQQTTGSTDKTRGLEFADLQTWLLLKLSQDPGQDAGGLIEQFLAGYYGEAAPRLRAYLDELESLREAMAVSLPWDPSLPMFTYLTPERLARWERAFDEMETLSLGSAGALQRVRTARINLDAAVLGKWRQMGTQRPDFGLTPEQLAERIRQAMAAEVRARCSPGREAQCWGPFPQQVDQMRLRARATLRPLPEPLAATPPDRLREVLPPMGAMVEDPDAAAGLALARDCELGVPVRLGLYDDHGRRELLSRAIPRDEVQPDRYRFYHLGRTTLSPQCRLWLTDAWVFTVPLEEAYVEGDPLAEWDIHASLKLTGPQYGSADPRQPNRIFCDRIVLVRAERPGKRDD